MTVWSRRYVAEFVGTFMIVFAPVTVSANRGSLLEAALVSGLVVLGMIYALGPISAAHFNPAVTLGFVAAKRFPSRHVAPYLVAQCLGSIAAAGLAAALFGAGHGTHIPKASPGVGVAVEALLTFWLMLVIIAVATDRRTNSAAPAIAIGLTVTTCVLVGGPLTGGSMNPARSLGPALFSPLALKDLWLYLMAPPLGAIGGALLCEMLRLSPDDATAAPEHP